MRLFIVYERWAAWRTLLAPVRALCRRVPTDDNIADLPSRSESGLEVLRAIGATERASRLANPYRMPEIWESLQERWV